MSGSDAPVERPEQSLRGALEDAERASSTSGGWPEHLSARQQEAWMVMRDVEATLVGSAQSRLGGGSVDRSLVRGARAQLDRPELEQWPDEEVRRWRKVAELIMR